MNKVISIFKKEIMGFVSNPSFLIVCALCSTMMSWIYPIQLSQFSRQLGGAMYMQQQGPSQMYNIHFGVFIQHLSYLNLILILMMPALTMRLFSEEKKLRTYDLLLTSPITSLQIVAGKYLSVLGALFLVMMLALSYPLVTVFFTSLSWGPLLIAFFGIFIVGAVYGAMDLFCSSLTESAIVSYVMAVIFNISIWFIGSGVEVVDSPWARQAFEHISLNHHLSGLVEGTIRTNGLVFFASLIFLFTFLAERVVESSRWR